MQNKLQGSRTEKNLLEAFSGESQARNKYTFFAAIARDEGYEQIGALFIETADNERAHAQRLAGLLSLIGDTKSNLKAAAAGENHEHNEMYPEFARIAKEEGFEDIAVVFTEIGDVEEYHEKRYLKLLNNIEQGSAFKRGQETGWHCRNCGYVHMGLEAPDLCPACSYPKSFYELWVEPY